MYKIDFTPPPELQNSSRVKVKSEDSSQKQTEHLQPVNNAKSMSPMIEHPISRNPFKSKIVQLTIILCLGAYTFASFYIPDKFSKPVPETIHSDVIFANMKTLSSNFELVFESPTAESIYQIEYQETALKNLKKIVSFHDNDASTLNSVLPLEIPKIETSIFEINENKKVLLVGTHNESTIEKFPININYALHYEGNVLQKIQAFLYTTEDFMIKDRLAGSTFAHWEKKSFLAIDRNISIFEANLATQPKVETKSNITNDDELIDETTQKNDANSTIKSESE